MNILIFSHISGAYMYGTISRSVLLTLVHLVSDISQTFGLPFLSFWLRFRGEYRSNILFEVFFRSGRFFGNVLVNVPLSLFIESISVQQYLGED